MPDTLAAPCSSLASRSSPSHARSCLWTFKPKGSSGQVDVEAEVLAYEKVRVPAGEFDAFHVRAVERVSGNSPINSVYAGEIVRNYWYAPAAHAIVRLASRNPYLGPSTVELVAFELR